MKILNIHLEFRLKIKDCYHLIICQGEENNIEIYLQQFVQQLILYDFTEIEKGL